jgi:hypothetical protein
MTYSPGDTFWLITAPVNPLIIKVTVLKAEVNGYWVDEPVGLVNEPNCVCPSKEEAVVRLNGQYAKGKLSFNSVAPSTLEQFRNLLLAFGAKVGYTSFPTLVGKIEGVDWYAYQPVHNEQ